MMDTIRIKKGRNWKRKLNGLGILINVWKKKEIFLLLKAYSISMITMI